MDQTKDQLSESKQKVATSFRELVQGAEELLRTATGYSGEGMDNAKQQMQAQVAHLKDLASQVEHEAIEKYRQVSASTDAYVRAKPWNAVAIAGIAGLIVGVIAARR